MKNDHLLRCSLVRLLALARRGCGDELSARVPRAAPPRSLARALQLAVFDRPAVRHCGADRAFRVDTRQIFAQVVMRLPADQGGTMQKTLFTIAFVLVVGSPAAAQFPATV